jgi:hypothetical protein
VLGNGVGKTAPFLDRACAERQRKSSFKSLLESFDREEQKRRRELSWRCGAVQKPQKNDQNSHPQF